MSQFFLSGEGLMIVKLKKMVFYMRCNAAILLYVLRFTTNSLRQNFDIL